MFAFSLLTQTETGKNLSVPSGFQKLKIKIHKTFHIGGYDNYRHTTKVDIL